MLIIASPKKDKLKFKKSAPLAEVSIPEATKLTKAQLNGFNLQVSGNTYSFVPSEGECDTDTWISSFRTAKEPHH